MSHITGYACVFSSKAQSFSFALELKGEPATASFAVATADAAEILLDMFEDATAAHFETETGEVTFKFEDLDAGDDEDEDEKAEGEDDDEEEMEDHGGATARERKSA